MSIPRLLRLAAALLATAPLVPAQTLRYTSTSMLPLDDVEITPDERYAVVRENNCFDFARIYDVTSWTLAAAVPGDCSTLAGECVDAVAVTNTRAVVLGGGIVQILDLTNVGNSLLAQHQAGYHPRDVAITPDGTIAAVRGGRTLQGLVGGQYLFDLATGNQVAFSPGEPTPYPSGPDYSFEVDDVEVTNAHAVMTSFVPAPLGPTTRVTIWELHPQGGGQPVVAFETVPCFGCGDQPGAPYDLAITPDGTKAVVRSELGVGVYDLSVSPPALLWQKRPHGGPGYFAEEALDAVEVTNERIVTISRVSAQQGGGAQVDLFDFASTQSWNRQPGSPHDLAITPDGTRALVRTSGRVALYDVASAPTGSEIQPLSTALAPSGASGFFAGFDSIALDDRFAVTLAQIAGQADMRVHFWDIGGPALRSIAVQTLSNNRPVDVALMPDHSRVAVAGNAGAAIYDLETGTLLFSHDSVPANVWWQWCDGIAVSANKVVSVGMFAPNQEGYIDLIDVAPFAANYCVGAPNSAGPGAQVSAGGDASIASGSFDLLVAGAPPSVRGRFTFGSMTAQVPFGNGFQCVAGSITGLSTLITNQAGAAADQLVYAQHGSLFQPGTTWHFQFVYRDPTAQPFGTNASDGMTITFGP